jgi:hypothetical protein
VNVSQLRHQHHQRHSPTGEVIVDKCVACQYYDRQPAKSNDGKGVMWGQCRRTAPMLHPIVAKSYMIEGVWPHVRDDDWCGEWKQTTRRVDTRPPELASTGPLVAGLAMPAAVPPRPASVPAMLHGAPASGLGLSRPAIGSATFATGLPGTAMTAAGRGD